MKKIVFLSALLCTLISCQNNKKYDATGIFEATTVTVSSETNGKLISFTVEEGDSVTMGQQVGLVDTTLLSLQQKQLMSQQSAVEKSSPDIAAQVAALRTQIAHQQNECDRIARLLAGGAATMKQGDDANAQLATLHGQLEGLLSTLDKDRSSITESASALQYQREQIEEQIRKSNIVAPITGTILQKYAEQGEYATPGRPLFKMANLDNIYLRSYFTASQLANITIGQEVTVIADFGGDEQYEYPGKIIWIAQESEFTPKSIQTQDTRANLVYAVKIAVSNDGRLKLGQYGEVRL
ncbi:MAG TPA: HlyD family efflux transporter periplasmic adaptor subunit [Candidatus Avibacteroides avistercoris]|uniref:HlyD family efflux transporter periplasmic adaptor subunit n=1 Tax=Candidatus Avibacteroides avistercoris TaxID=2840690 RepID=A0A9D2UHZ1_9BACT|nr:HlyD family efflux transporter periplasmic adaptor subunit [Candidatus Avibacteroides avistercoris]